MGPLPLDDATRQAFGVKPGWWFGLIVNATGARTPIPPAVREAMVSRDGVRQE